MLHCHEHNDLLLGSTYSSEQENSNFQQDLRVCSRSRENNNVLRATRALRSSFSVEHLQRDKSQGEIVMVVLEGPDTAASYQLPWGSRGVLFIPILFLLLLLLFLPLTLPPLSYTGPTLINVHFSLIQVSNLIKDVISTPQWVSADKNSWNFGSSRGCITRGLAQSALRQKATSLFSKWETERFLNCCMQPIILLLTVNFSVVRFWLNYTLPACFYCPWPQATSFFFSFSWTVRIFILTNLFFCIFFSFWTVPLLNFFFTGILLTQSPCFVTYNTVFI